MRLRLSPQAAQDIAAALRRSQVEFGNEARDRYSALMRQALKDLRADPLRPGVRGDPALQAGVRLYHLRHSRLKLAADQRVGSPRHYIAFRVSRDELIILRVLHDAMDLPSRLADL